MTLGATFKGAPSRREFKAGRKAAAVLTASAIGLTGSIALNTGIAAAETTAAPQGCSYGKGGPAADALCWIDFSAFGTVKKADLDAGDVSKNLDIKLGTYQVTMTATVSKGAQGANGIDATALPTWWAVMGQTVGSQPFYLQTAGKPAFYQLNEAGNEVTEENSQRDTIKLSDIVVKDKDGRTVTSGYSLVVSDAESTDQNEGFTWTSDSKLVKYQNVVPTGWQEPCVGGLTGVGSTQVDCTGGGRKSNDRGIMMVSADAPTWISSAFRNNAYATSRQGVAFALVFSTVNTQVEVKQGGGSNATFETTATSGDVPVGTATSNGSTNESGLQQILSKPEGSDITYTVNHTSGTPVAAYDIVWECYVNGSKVDPTVTDGKASINVPANGTGTCKATATAKPPVTGPDTETINPNTTATLTPETTPGKGAITKAVFDNGQTTKKVDGEGTWDIKLVNGKVVSTFTPKEDYTGKVTQQPYTVTDEFGLTAASTLDVKINVPLTTGPDAVTVAQGETATLSPKAIKGSGDIKAATFDNGETTKKVDGQGTWEIKLADGQPVATFTPEKGFTGPVTQQKYTVTDTNKLTATSTLDVTILKPAPEPTPTPKPTPTPEPGKPGKPGLPSTGV